MNLEFAKVGVRRRKTVAKEGRAEDRNKRPADVVTECEANGTGTVVIEPVPLRRQRAASHRYGERLETWCSGEGFVGRRLW